MKPHPSTSKIVKKFIFIPLALLTFAIFAIFASPTQLFFTSLFVDDNLLAIKLASQNSSIDDDIASGTYQSLPCPVVIYGGGTGGVFAAIQSARMGVETCLVSEAPVLGGMLSAAGVTGIDGRKDTPNGLFKEFVDQVNSYYLEKGLPTSTKNCLVSYLCYEPRVGQIIIDQMIAAESDFLRVYKNVTLEKIYRTKDLIEGISFSDQDGRYLAASFVLVDASDFGDLMFLADIPFRLGDQSDLAEDRHFEGRFENCIQPLTWVAIIKRKSPPLKDNDFYQNDAFNCSVPNKSCPRSATQFSLDRLMGYGKLPNEKLMINIPSHSFGNDFNATDPAYDDLSREQIFNLAKVHTLQYVYYLQKTLRLDYGIFNEFGSFDSLAHVPYVRESRRLKGLYTLQLDDISAAKNSRPRTFPDAMAIGDYPIDLHFCTKGIGDIYEPVVPYQVPLRSAIPEKVDGFLVAEKNISVSRLANGTTRMQPIVTNIGQAVGLASALSYIEGVQPRDLSIDLFNHTLIEQGVTLLYFQDVKPDDYFFEPVQHFAVKGLVSGYQDMTFQPGKAIYKTDLIKFYSRAFPEIDFSKINSLNGQYVSKTELLTFIESQLNQSLRGSAEAENYLSMVKVAKIAENFIDTKRPVNRAEAITIAYRLKHHLNAEQE